MSWFKRFLGRKPVALSYEAQRDLVAHGDAHVRADLATREDMRPEILYYLAEDAAPEVRRRVAANASAPPHANLKLASDADETVRGDLAVKIARLAPGLSDSEQDRVRHMTHEALETLARDQIPKVRQILAEALKDVANAPPEVIRRLALDADAAVFEPILQYSPVLTDADLLGIIAAAPVSRALAAISRRAVVTDRVADAIVNSDDIPAITALLANKSAQIREETLDRLVERAPDVGAWHKPMIQRPHLSAKTAQKLARFVAAELLRALAERRDIDPAAVDAVAQVVRKRIDEMGPSAPAKTAAKVAQDEDAALIRVRALEAEGKLDETTIDTALSGGDFTFVIAALAVKGEFPVSMVKKTIALQSAKGIVAVAWKAGVSMDMAVQLQAKLLGLTSGRLLYPRAGDFPLTGDEMRWQLEFLGSN